jgi:hypothetical protein
MRARLVSGPRASYAPNFATSRAQAGTKLIGSISNMHDAIVDRQRIREVVENWVVWRDAGDWERFRSVWHPDGRMMATWIQGPAERFIEVSREGWNKGVSILHFLGGSAIDVVAARAIAQTKMTISQRASVDGIDCDVVCTGRFYDFFENRDDSWAIVLRQPIYEKDRIDPVDPGARLVLDPALLAQFPEGYRHLAYVQTKIGFTVKRDMPMLKGPAVERLYADGADWLAGKPLNR